MHIETFKDQNGSGIKFKGSGWVFYEANRAVQVSEIQKLILPRLFGMLVTVIMFFTFA